MLTVGKSTQGQHSDEKKSSHISFKTSNNSEDIQFYSSSRDEETIIVDTEQSLKMKNDSGGSNISPELLFERRQDQNTGRRSLVGELMKKGAITGAVFVRETGIMGEARSSSSSIRGLGTTEIDVLAPLGAGGEGKVYLGRVKELNQLVAFKQFKVLNNEAEEKKIFQRIKKEMDLVKQLDHPHIVKYFTIHKSNIG